jgi:hypothetical protein
VSQNPGDDRNGSVRPMWVCVSSSGGGEAEDNEWEEYAKRLKAAKTAAAQPRAEDHTGPEEGEAPTESRKVTRMLDPRLPTKAEVAEHQLTHLPFRNWCPHCVKGRGKERDHRKQEGEDRGIPEYHVDYCFPGNASGEKLTVLAIVEKHTKMRKAVVVPAKGSTGRYAARMVLDLIHECGDKDRDVIMKSDQEPAIKALVNDICMARTGAKTIVENSPVGSKGSNGIVERTVQMVEQYLRTMKSQLDTRYKVDVDIKHPIVTWMCEYSTFLLNRLEVAADGKTSYERCKGKRANVMGLEFAEKIMWKHKSPTAKLEKLEPRWGHGLFVGVKVSSNEMVIMDEETKTVKFTRTVRRVPEEERWQVENLTWVRAVPWNLGPGDKEEDGEMPELGIKHGPGTRLTAGEMEEIQARADPEITHRAHLTKNDFEKFGYTDNCRGCAAKLRGMKPQPHAEHCRKRMEQLLEGDERLDRAKARREDKRRGREEGKEEEEEGKQGQEDKRRRMDEIEMEAMQTEDIEELGKLYTEYMMEEAKLEGKVEKDTKMEELSSSSAGAARYAEREEEPRAKRSKNEAEMDVNAIIKDPNGHYAWDDVNNMEIPLDEVRAARKEEMGYMKNVKFKVVKKAEAYDKTGRAPLSTKWVDTDKTHGTGKANIRARWVARDFKPRGEKDREDLFCATPPLELLRFVLSKQATRRPDGRERKTMFIDVKKAHLVPECKEDVFVELPEEAEVQEDECGKLLYWLYGCRKAGQAWEDHYSEVLCRAGHTRARSSPVAFYHSARDLWAVVHGDDFTFTGLDEDLDFILGVLTDNYEIKNRGRLGTGPKDVREIDILGRRVKLHEWGVSWGGDPRHRDKILAHFGLTGESKGLSKNGYKEEQAQGAIDEEELDADGHRTFRGLAATVNFMSLDNPALQFPAKEVCRRMASPTQNDIATLKRLARFMVSLEGAEICYPWQSEAEAKELRVYVDSDWAGCAKTRRSTSGGVLMVGRHVLRTWSVTQAVTALSSAEAEFYAMIEGGTRGIGLKNMLNELGGDFTEVVLFTDSSAAKGFSSQRGLSKIRHIETKDLWLQEAVKDKRIKLMTVPGTANPADILTKFHDVSSLVCLCEKMNVSLSVATSSQRLKSQGAC